MLSNVLLDLATHTEYISPLREEIEETIAQHGWSKASMAKMRKVDSFVKEVNRLTVLSGSQSLLDIMSTITDCYYLGL